MSKNFNWNDEEMQEDIIVPSVQAIAVYRNPSLDIVIRQQDPLGEEDQVIVIPRSRAKEIIKAIQKNLKD